MKKDIHIPSVKDIFVAVVRQENKDFRTQDWNVFLINNKTAPIDTALIVSQGSHKEKTTSILRHSLKVLPAKSFAKIEFLEPQLLKVDNRFSVSFFENGKMLHKNFLFKKGGIDEKNLVEIPVIPHKGILAE